MNSKVANIESVSNAAESLRVSVVLNPSLQLNAVNSKAETTPKTRGPGRPTNAESIDLLKEMNAWRIEDRNYLNKLKEKISEEIAGVQASNACLIQAVKEELSAENEKLIVEVNTIKARLTTLEEQWLDAWSPATKCDVPGRPIGGLLTLTCHNTNPQTHHVSNFWIITKTSSLDLTVFVTSVYMPPSADLTEILDELQEVMHHIMSTHHHDVFILY
ncbi:hypothetical protein KQX54_002962 [Cotesia glomerata]|uniref:Uncharacterized protein n=1 Tax=Cotesia glomerata TaxID=32391 RepID=A0AAV7HWK6_COTGL|nr:hypothetical protein KQX54_002962 [Cotesia glomerata]